MALSFKKLAALDPFVLHTMINSKGQEIHFWEHPLRGEEAEIICACPAIGKAEYSGFHETDDMLASHGEYEPWFDENGVLQIGDLGPARS